VIDDPIVAEVRKARQEIFRECGYSLEKLVRHLERRRKAEESAVTPPGGERPLGSAINRSDPDTSKPPVRNRKRREPSVVLLRPKRTKKK